jgi:hypothetical protein
VYLAIILHAFKKLIKHFFNSNAEEYFLDRPGKKNDSEEFYEHKLVTTPKLY